MNGKRITISGYYGFHNAGDEAVLAGLIKSLRSLPGEAPEITVLSIDPAETSTTHGVDSAHRYRLGPLFNALSKTDLLISGGGSLLQDVTSSHGIFYYAAVVRLAQMMSKRTMFAAQGIGPLLRARSRRLVAGIANRLDAITVRDAESLALLKEIGVTRPSMEVTADPALLLPEPLEPASKAVNQVVVALRPWSGETSVAERVADACAAAMPTASVYSLSMQPPADDPIMARFAARWPGAPPVEVRSDSDRLGAIIEALAGAEMVVAMRLHALILAAGAGVPAVAISYDPKIDAFMRSTGQDDAVVAVDDTDRLTEVIDRVWREREARANRLRALLPDLRKAAARSAEIAGGLL